MHNNYKILFDINAVCDNSEKWSLNPSAPVINRQSITSVWKLDRQINTYMLFSCWEVRKLNNCDRP